MGNSQSPTKQTKVISCPYEEVKKVIIARLPLQETISYGRPAHPFRNLAEKIRRSPAWSASRRASRATDGGHQDSTGNDAPHVSDAPSVTPPLSSRSGAQRGSESNSNNTINRTLTDHAKNDSTNKVSDRHLAAGPETAIDSSPERTSPTTAAAYNGATSDKAVQPYSSVTVPIYGAIQNHKPFLEPQILECLLPFLLDSTFSACVSVCPHWFICFYSFLFAKCSKCIANFDRLYQGYLEVDKATLSVQPLFTASASAARLDLLLYAKVLSPCVGKCIQFGYSFGYRVPEVFAPPLLSGSHRPSASSSPSSSFRSSREHHVGHTGDCPSPGEISRRGAQRRCDGDEDTAFSSAISDRSHSGGPRILAPYQSTYGSAAAGGGGAGSAGGSGNSHRAARRREYQSFFRCEVLRQGAARSVWVQRDLCRFHGDEIMVATLANVPTVCKDDRVEIPVSISNAFGIVDLETFRWLPISSITAPGERLFGQTCEVERLISNDSWMDLDSFQPTTTERLQINDHFRPQWQHKSTKFSGCDIAYSRSIYVAAETGVVPGTHQWLGMESFVKAAGSPIIVPLTRLGLQHDRFSRQQLRKGDTLILYVCQGGGVG